MPVTACAYNHNPIFESDLSGRAFGCTSAKDGDAAHRVQKISGIIYIQYSSDALIFHEAAHIRQSLESKNGVSFSKENYLLYCRSDCAIQSKSEVDAYQIKL